MNKKFLVISLILIIALVACGGNNANNMNNDNSGEDTTEDDTTTVEPLKFGMILVGPKNDHGWSQAHYEGGQYIEAHISGSEMIVFEISLRPT